MPVDWGAVISGAAQVAGQVAAARASGRAQEQQIANQTNNASTERYSTEQNARIAALKVMLDNLMQRADLDMKRRGFANDEIGANLGRAQAGDRIARQTDVTITHPRAFIPKITGGYKASDRSPQLKAMGEDVVRQALIKQMTGGEQFDQLPEVNPMESLITPPESVQGSKSGTFDTLLNWLALGGSAAGIWKGAQKPRDVTQQPTPYAELPPTPYTPSGNSGNWT